MRRALWHRKHRDIYAAWVLHPDTGRIVCGYVGKDSSPPSRRTEHMLGGTSRCPSPAPWADTVICWRLPYSGRCSAFTLWWLEIMFIVLLRPIYNYQWNRWNRRRIPIYVAARRERGPLFYAARQAYTGIPWRLRLLRAG
jgi:hypothetical protein